MKTIGKAELAKIHIWKSRLGMDDESYRALLCRFEVTSSKELSYARYREIKLTFETLLNAAGMATDAQLIMIRDLAKGAVKNLPGFCSKICGREIGSPRSSTSVSSRGSGIHAVGELKANEARKVIEALKRYHRESKG